MLTFEHCWAPCFTVKNSNRIRLTTACVIIAVYTGVLHLLSLTYAVHVLQGGRSDAFYSPLFEFSKYGMSWICSFLILYSLFYIAICSMGLIHGVRTEIRFFYLPWLYCTALEISFMALFGLFMIYRYWHDLWATFAFLVLWSYAGYHCYLYLAVISQYYFLKDIQEPTFIILYP